MEPDVELIHARGSAGIALSLIEIASELNIMRNRGEKLPSGPIMGNHISNLLTAAVSELAKIVPEGQFYIHQYKELCHGNP